MMQQGYNEIYIESNCDSNIVKITRENPLTLESFVMVVHLNHGLRETPLLLLEEKQELWKASCLGSPNVCNRRWLRNSSRGLLQEEIILSNVDITVLASFRIPENIPNLEYSLDMLGLHDFVRIEKRNYFCDSHISNCSKNEAIASGASSPQKVYFEQFEILKSPRSDNEIDVEFMVSNFSYRSKLLENEVKIKFSPTGFLNGSIFLFKKAPLACIKNVINEMDAFLLADWPPIQHLNHVDFNIIMYRTQEEDHDAAQELNGYVFPGVTEQLVYQGLAGILPFFDKWMPDVNKSAIAENIRQGDWFVDYIFKRLHIYGKRLGCGLLDLADFLEKSYLRHYKAALPCYLKPRYLIKFLQAFNEKIIACIISLKFPLRYSSLT
jgi:Central domain of human glycogen debranching enzyme